MQEIELYSFASGGHQLHLTPHEFDVDLGGLLYASTTMERSDLALGAEAAKMALDLRLPPDHSLVQHLLAAAVTGAITSVTLRTARRHAVSNHWQTVGTRWVGRVLGVEVTEGLARIRCESAQVSMKRIGLRRLYSRQCSHVLYSSECAAAPVSAVATVLGVSGTQVTLTDAVPAAVAGGLPGGWLQTPDGARHMIVREEWGAVHLLYPAASIVPGANVTLTAGCDRSTTTCAGRFNNLDNYGGFPAIPNKNPFGNAIF